MHTTAQGGAKPCSSPIRQKAPGALQRRPGCSLIFLRAVIFYRFPDASRAAAMP